MFGSSSASNNNLAKKKEMPTSKSMPVVPTTASGSSSADVEEFDESNVATNLVPESERSSFLSFLKRAMGGIDLSKITAPPFILAACSTLETNSHMMCQPDIFSSIPLQKTPMERMIMVVKWYVSRYYNKSLSQFSGKKPYNPILGEQFLCHWDGEHGSVNLISEQVSHHPPVLGEFYWNEETGIVNMSHFGLQSYFAGTIVKASVNAHNSTFLLNVNEEYTCTFPNFVIRGFMVANPFFDAVGEGYIACKETGISAIIEFKDKPWFRGEYHGLGGKIFTSGNEENAEYTLSGNWKKDVFITNNATGEKSVLFHVGFSSISQVIAPVNQQGPMESQKVWEKVTTALLQQNYSVAGEAKNIIEEEQRKLRKERETKGEEFRHKYFTFDSNKGIWIFTDYEQYFEKIRNHLAAKKGIENLSLNSNSKTGATDPADDEDEDDDVFEDATSG